MKKLISILLALVLVLGLAACGAANNESSTPSKTDKGETVTKLDVDCNVYGIKGPTGVGMVSLMKKAEDGNANLNYKFNMVGANEEIIAKIANKEADIAAVATNLASTLYAKTNGGISVLAINTLGVLCVVTKGVEINSIADLKGKTVYTTGQGANPEYITKYILEKNGLTVGTDVTLEFKAEPTELVAQVVSNENAIVIAPQPVATSITVKDKNAKIALDMNDEWEKVSNTKLVMGCVIARNDYIKENPEAVKVFLKEYEESITAVNNDVDTAATLCESYGIVSPAAIAKKAIPYCNIVYRDGEDLKTDLSAYLQFLFEKAPASVGGALPKADFYYDAK